MFLLFLNKSSSLSQKRRNNRNIFTKTLEGCIAHFPRLGTDVFIKHVTDIEISSKESKLVSCINPPKKGFYMLAFYCLFPCDDHDPIIGCVILRFEVDRKVYFDNIYHCMLTKNECDLIWKMMHGAIPTGRCLSPWAR